MFYKQDELPNLVGKNIAVVTIDNKFYYGILKAVIGTQIELAFPKRYVEYIYKTAIRCVADDIEEIKMPNGNGWIR